ncbi:uncharacterized protein FA14DRAFT_19570 [Meira miltonrushii]|uniref:Uncharacterized protein n=1 Tax=Meira miltonrushii TaxID=1280837 RepID=A0A316VN38_9BASI|nr:uncharacterized protein FA14DRAFT_19570 [Meira miltonrushii]PWN37823.1 hypothetical protein FA14DRAFT_19570 [Meira miltonrushii]
MTSTTSSSQRKGSTASNHTTSISEDGQKDINRQTFTPFGASFPSRRSSTPAASFIPPRFWQAAGYTQNASSQNEQTTASPPTPQQTPFLQRASTSSATLTSGNKLQQSNSHSGETHQHSSGSPMQQHGFMGLPRRTSFGTVLGGNRLTAFTALGMGSGANQGNNPNRTSQPSNTSTDSVNSVGLKSKSSFGTLPGLQESAISTSTDSTPAPSMPSSPVQKPQKTRTVYLPGPDGICVESRSRRRSEA